MLSSRPAANRMLETPTSRWTSPSLWLIGGVVFTGMVVGLASCDDGRDGEPAVTVRRASYASLEDCQADWTQPGDCESAPIDQVRERYGASVDNYLADKNNGSGGSLGYYSGTGNGSPGGGAHVIPRWYGPYYTEAGTVYHPDGTQTRNWMATPASGTASGVNPDGTPVRTWVSSMRMRPMRSYSGDGSFITVPAPAPPRAVFIEEATVRSSSLGRGAMSSPGMSMRSAAVSHAPVSSRGGFGSRFGGGRSGGG